MKKYSIETTVGIFVVAGLICVGYMTVKLGRLSLFGEETYPLKARFASVADSGPAARSKSTASK